MAHSFLSVLFSATLPSTFLWDFCSFFHVIHFLLSLDIRQCCWIYLESTIANSHLLWLSYIYEMHTYIYLCLYTYVRIYFLRHSRFPVFYENSYTAKGWIQKLFRRHQELSAYHSIYLMIFKCLSLARFLTVGRMDWVCHFELVNAVWQMFSKSWLNN